jgi:anhydro-N-acetylmuramic acid kinase
MKRDVAKAMIVAGVMSGTSADGVDVALCRVSPTIEAGGSPRLKLLGHRSFPYDKKLRASVLAAASGEAFPAADFSQLSWRLGELYAECIAVTAEELKVKPQLVAIHGQTIHHQAVAASFLGRPTRSTWQIGEAAPIAERLRIPVISDFRPADLAAGGQGAPLVPVLDYCLFRHATKNRLLLNLGGIANITALPARCGTEGVLAFDTGPANMLIDAVMQRLYNRRFDKDGAVAARGKALHGEMWSKYFGIAPPKSCGREEFGAVYVDRFLQQFEPEGAKQQDIVATVTALTAFGILAAHKAFCAPHLARNAPGARVTELFAAGGGAKNATLMRWLTEGFAELGVRVSTTQDVGLPVEAKEAAAFALLGWLRWHELPGNIPSATGAKRAVVLGKVTSA